VLEGTASNVFALSGGRLLTPPAEDCLPGITRGRVLELAQQDGIEAIEAPLDVETLVNAQEAFVTNAVQGLRPIARIDGRPLGSERGVFARLANLYEADRAAGRREPHRAAGRWEPHRAAGRWEPDRAAGRRDRAAGEPHRPG
jgi:branched-chain amino acid aminotransferase